MKLSSFSWPVSFLLILISLRITISSQVSSKSTLTIAISKIPTFFIDAISLSNKNGFQEDFDDFYAVCVYFLCDFELRCRLIQHVLILLYTYFFINWQLCFFSYFVFVQWLTRNIFVSFVVNLSSIILRISICLHIVICSDMCLVF